MTGASQRIDKWLWFARIVKTRSLAAALVGGGKVRVNRQKIAKPSHCVAPGDVLTIALRGRVRVLEVRQPGTRRGPAPEARLLFEDLAAPSSDAPETNEPETDAPDTSAPDTSAPGTGDPDTGDREG